MALVPRRRNLLALAFAAGVFATSLPCQAAAEKITARWVLTELSILEYHAYLNGAVEALAFARYLRERPSREGMNCITGWYRSNDTVTLRRALLKLAQKHEQAALSALIHFMSRKHCGN